MHKMFIAILGLLIAGPSFSAALDMRSICSDAKWFVHLDAKLALSSSTVKTLLADAGQFGIDAKIQKFQNIFQMDPLKNISDITLYGPSEDESQAIAIVRGSLNNDKLIELATEQQPYSRLEYSGFTIHQWTDKRQKKQKFGCFFSSNVLVIGGQAQTVQKALDVLSGKATGFIPQEAVMSPSNSSGVFFTAYGQDLNSFKKKAFLLDTSNSALFEFGEINGNIFSTTKLSTDSAETAKAQEQFINGLIAYGLLAGQKKPELLQLAKGAHASINNNIVTIESSYPATDVAEMVKKHCIKTRQSETDAPDAKNQ